MGEPGECCKCKGRPRSAQSEAAIRAAMLELLAEMPLRDVTVEGLARKAGVGKATIYKWWPCKAYVALDAFLARMRMSVDIPHARTARAYFTEHLKSVTRFYTSTTGRLFCQFIAEGQSNPEFAALFRERFLSNRREEAKEALRLAVERGEIRGDLDLDLMLDLIYGPAIYRLLAGHAPLNDAETEHMVAVAFDGIASRVKSRGRSSRPARDATGS